MTKARKGDNEAKNPSSSRKSTRDGLLERLDAEGGKRVHQLLSQTLPTAQKFVDDNGEEISRVVDIMKMIVDLEPRDEAERMLVAQMIATHEAAMECFRRAMLPDQPYQGRDMNLKNAAKLTSLYARQVDALDKHRGKGKQKITVEHVNVHAGGQAIVGDVNATKAGTTPTAAQPQQAGSSTDESAASDDGEKLRHALSAKKVPAKKHAGK